MANRVKEDEKNERIIRGLLKLPDNRRCINCNSLGPQYVCTNFWTFVCTTCSGIHREFTHRVKSISMAKFTSQEVSALQEGGNQRAKEIYFKEWDPQRQSSPDSSNVERLRDFIKHVYVDRRFTGERNYDKPPRVKMGDREDFNENRRMETYQGGSRSPLYEDAYERRYNERSSPGGRSDDKNSRYGYDERSPGYEQESRQYGDYRRSSPARPAIINDWRRDDRFQNGRKFDDRRASDGDTKLEGRSPERLKDLELSSPPVVRPVREILGDNVMPLRISEPPKVNGGRTADSSVHTQRTASSGSLGSTNENPAEVKLENTGSLIDFGADPEPPVTAAVTLAQQTTLAQSVAQPASNDNNWASFDFAPNTKVTQTPSNSNTLESVFSQLSVPASVPGQVLGISNSAGAPITSVANISALPVGGGPPVAPLGHTPTSSFSSVASAAAPPVISFATFPSANTFGIQHQQRSLFPTATGQSAAPHSTPPVDGASSSQPWSLSPAQKPQGPLGAPAAQALQFVPSSAPDVATAGVSQPFSVEVKLTGRKPLPEDLFATTYSPYPAAVLGWQIGPPRGIGFPMHYNTVAPMQPFVQSKSTNPFDVNNESPPVQAQTFPSMASLQGALPNVSPPSALMQTSSPGAPSPSWMPPQPSPYPSAMPSQTPTYASALPSQTPAYASAMPSQTPLYASAMPSQTLAYASAMPSQTLAYASAMPPRAYIGPQVTSNMPSSGHQGVGGIGSAGPTFGIMNPEQLAGRFSAPAPRPYSSAGGNPFG